MVIQSFNPSTNLATQPQAESGKVLLQADRSSQPSLLVMNGDYCYVQFQVSTKRALVFMGGAGLMLLGKLNPELFDVVWALLF